MGTPNLLLLMGQMHTHLQRGTCAALNMHFGWALRLAHSWDTQAKGAPSSRFPARLREGEAPSSASTILGGSRLDGPSILGPKTKSAQGTHDFGLQNRKTCKDAPSDTFPS